MPLPIPNLDDRRFDDLVAEARARLANHLPELTQIAPGDPAHAMIDLFAYLTETILYRANLIPERQRRAILNLLQIPLRNARPSRGVVCVDATPWGAQLPPLIRDGAQFKAGGQQFTGSGELQPTPLAMTVLVKQLIAPETLLEMGLTLQDLSDQYGMKAGDTPQPFQPYAFDPARETLSLADSLDRFFYMALTLPKQVLSYRDELRQNLAGITLNIAIAPADDLDAEEVNSLSARGLAWELLSQTAEGELLALPLEIVSDSSRGGRQTGVVRLRLPPNPQLFTSFAVADPMFAGLGDEPPELPAPLTSEKVICWLRLSCPDEPDLALGYLGINGLDVSGQGLKQDVIVGLGTGKPDQVIKLPDDHLDPDSLQLDVEEGPVWVPWQRVEFLVDNGGDARVYKLDPVTGVVYFGDGLQGGKRPPAGMRIRIASYRFGGGQAGNVSAGEIKELVGASSRVQVRHEWPCKGGIDAESIAQAERRIPQFLTHRNRAVTPQDFQILARNNPVNPVARAEVMAGFMPGTSIRAARTQIPGVVSVFVLPPRAPALHQSPRPSKGLLKDVFEYLLARVTIGTELYVLSPEFVPLAVSVNVAVLDPDTEQETRQAVQRALVEYLWPLTPGGAHGTGWPMGVPVSPRELQTHIARVTGVRVVRALNLFRRDPDLGWQRLSEDQVLPLLAYQLPELMAVEVGTGEGEPRFPRGLSDPDGTAGGPDGDSSGTGSGGGNGRTRNIPAPVIPEVC